MRLGAFNDKKSTNLSSSNMYKKNKTRLKKFKRIIHWLKRKLILISAAFMIGLSNAMYNENEMINKDNKHTEQKK
jgi:cytochrome b561